jgi:ammonium transporter Rh
MGTGNASRAWYIGLLLGEIGMIALFGVFVRYGSSVDVVPLGTDGVGDELKEYYASYQDVHVMIFVGFGFLMTFLRRHGYSALGYTFLLACIALQFSVLTRGFWACVFKGEWSYISIDVTT